MRAIIAGTKRETLLQEIHNAFLQWPELERKIFAQAHYYGQSPEAISRSLQLDAEEVRATLKQCERRLYTSLTRIIHETSTPAPDPDMSAALRSVGLLDVPSSTSAGPSVARLASTPVCAASLRTLISNAG